MGALAVGLEVEGLVGGLYEDLAVPLLLGSAGALVGLEDIVLDMQGGGLDGFGVIASPGIGKGGGKGK